MRKVFFCTLTFFVCLGLYTLSVNPTNATPPRKQLVDRHFSRWDGSHNGVTKMIKSAMHDPSSYRHSKTKYWDVDSHIVVHTDYFGRNKFGGTVRSYVRATVDFDGKVIAIQSQGVY